MKRVLRLVAVAPACLIIAGVIAFFVLVPTWPTCRANQAALETEMRRLFHDVPSGVV